MAVIFRDLSPRAVEALIALGGSPSEDSKYVITVDTDLSANDWLLSQLETNPASLPHRRPLLRLLRLGKVRGT